MSDCRSVEVQQERHVRRLPERIGQVACAARRNLAQLVQQVRALVPVAAEPRDQVLAEVEGKALSPRQTVRGKTDEAVRHAVRRHVETDDVAGIVDTVDRRLRRAWHIDR
jgi:hypothetical protein